MHGRQSSQAHFGGAQIKYGISTDPTLIGAFIEASIACVLLHVHERTGNMQEGGRGVHKICTHADPEINGRDSPILKFNRSGLHGRAKERNIKGKAWGKPLAPSSSEQKNLCLVVSHA